MISFIKLYEHFLKRISETTPEVLLKLFSLLTLIFIGFSILFARPFVGLFLFGFRLGELAIGVLMILSIITFFVPKRLVSEKLQNPLVIFKVIILLFVISLFSSNSSFLNLYTYKTSSYIWTFFMFFVGYLLITRYDYSFNLRYFLLLIPIFTYIISTGNYPNIIIDFFNAYSDKFQFIKAADLAIGLYVSTLILNKHMISKITAFNLTVLVTTIFIPLMLFNSRGSFFSILVFLFIFLYQKRSLILNNKINFLIVVIFCCISFLLSTFRVYGNFDFYKEPDTINTELVIDSIKGISNNKEPARVFLSFYIQDGYLMSWDPTTDWRLDIWQDVFYDLIDRGQIVIGYGYKEIIPIMLDPTAPGRLGRDGLNENVHNYFVNILARGGLLQLFAFLFLYIYLIRWYKFEHSDYKIMILIIPIMILSSLDVTMEGVNFPIIFYTYLGYVMKKGI
mgnify:CR=1 FL=1